MDTLGNKCKKFRVVKLYHFWRRGSLEQGVNANRRKYLGNSWSNLYVGREG